MVDDIFSEDDDNYLEDISDSKGFLSEDSECPYILEDEHEDGDGDNGALLGENMKIHMEIAMRKRKLDGVLEKDPKFSEFMESRRADLEPSRIEEIYSDEEDGADHPVGDEFTEHQHDKKTLTSCTIDDDLKKIYNWQYINCINLWVKFISCNIKDHDLWPLSSLLIEVISGLAYLFPGLRYVPLRFRCVQMLNKLTSATGVFIPIASLVFDCLDYKGSNNADTRRSKPFDFASVLKVPKQLLKSRDFHEECIDWSCF